MPTQWKVNGFTLREHRLLPLSEREPADRLWWLLAIGFASGLAWREIWEAIT